MVWKPWTGEPTLESVVKAYCDEQRSRYELLEELGELRTELSESTLLLKNNQERREEVESHHGGLLRENRRLREVLNSIAGLESECSINPGWNGLIVAVRRATAALGLPNIPTPSCTATIYHGPSHQSRTTCNRRGPHEVHWTQYGEFNQDATWRGDKVFSGYFDEAPHEDDE